MQPQTPVWRVDKDKPDEQLAEAVKLLKEGQVIGFPTETVYGLGGSIWSDDAIKKIFAAKGRPSDNPLIVHIWSNDQLNELVQSVPKVAQKLMDHFWPGPLTIVFNLKKGCKMSPLVSCGLQSVGIRMPKHSVALALLRMCNLPLAAPSANTSTRPSPTKAEHVLSDLRGLIGGVVDGGPTGVGLESTVVDCTLGEGCVVILRPGGVTIDHIREALGESVEVTRAKLAAGHSQDKDDDKSKASEKKAAAGPKAPGMKYVHYAPKAPLHLVYGDDRLMQGIIDQSRTKGLRVGVITTEEKMASGGKPAAFSADKVIACGRRADLATVARNLYDVLRQFDHTDVQVIYCEVFPNEGLGQAVMNRLQKASKKKIYNCSEKL